MRRDDVDSDNTPLSDLDHNDFIHTITGIVDDDVLKVYMTVTGSDV